MRTAALLFAASMSLVWSQSDPEIKKAEAAWVAAITKSDRAALEKVLSDDLVYTHSSGVVENKAQYIGVVTAGTQKYDLVEFTDVKAPRYGDTVVLTARAHMKGVNKQGPFDHQLRVIHVWVKKGGAWQLVAHQTTRLP